MNAMATTDRPTTATESSRNGSIAEAELHLGESVLHMPIEEGTEGERAMDVSALLKNAGVTTLDDGYANTGIDALAPSRSSMATTASCATAATPSNSWRSRPLRRGCLPADLRRTAHGRAAAMVGRQIVRHTMLHEDMQRFFDGFPRDAHPMAILSSAVARAVHLLPGLAAIRTIRSRSRSALSGCWPSCRRSPRSATRSRSASPSSIRERTRLRVNFLQMMFAVPSEPYQVDPDVVAALTLLLIVHADHEQNCSTSTVRMVGSSRRQPVRSISAGIAALWGPLHGGANQEVRGDARSRSRPTAATSRSYVDRAKDKNEQLPADGLWPPRLQELRSARHDHQEAPATSSSRRWAATTSCSTSPSSWKRSR